MPRLPNADPVAEPSRHHGPPNTRNLIAATLDEWQRVNGNLPPPLPLDSGDAANWWLKDMQEPELPGETRRIPRGDSTFWHLGYFVRTRQSLLNFMRLDQPQRDTVVAAVEDGIPYRGDDWEMFKRIIRETDQMLSVGADVYRKKAIAGMKSLHFGAA